MALGMQAKKELQAELEQAERRVAAIREILAPYLEESAAEKIPANGAHRTSSPKPPGIKRTGLRDEIRKVLAAGTGYGPTELAREIRRGNFEDEDAKTPLSVRVGNECRRMYSAGQLRKRGKKYYAVAESNSQPKAED